MKKLNKKGFTLIELLAVIIILGVLLLIAVPSVSKYIQQSREKTYVTNLSKIVDAVSTEVNSYSGDYTFNTKEYLVVPIVCVELERGSSEKSPFSKYLPLQSYVVVTRNESNGFDYRVTALDETGYGVKLAKSDAASVVKDATPAEITKTTTADGKSVYSLSLSDMGELTAKVITPGSTCESKLGA